MAENRLYLTFGIDQERFALPIERVQEILDMRPISRLPHAPPHIVGLIDVRGAGLLVIDLRGKFGFPPIEATNRTRIIVVNAVVEGKSLGVGVVTDCVFAVSDLSGAALEPPPSIGSRWRSDFVIGVGRETGQFVIVLDLDRLIGSNEVNAASGSELAA